MLDGGINKEGCFIDEYRMFTYKIHYKNNSFDVMFASIISKRNILYTTKLNYAMNFDNEIVNVVYK